MSESVPDPDVDAVAERTYERAGPAGAAEVRLRLGRPEPDPRPNGDWRCRVVITGLGRPIDQHAYGIDAVQALILAMQMASAYLTYAPLGAGERLTWLGEVDFGLPRAGPWPAE